MQVSPGRLTGIRVVLGGVGFIALVGAVTQLLFPTATFEGNAPAGEPFTSTTKAIMMMAGAISLPWAVAAALAIGKPLENRRLLQALIAAMGIIGLIGIYVNTAVSERATALSLGAPILALALAVALWVLYPWGAKSS